MFRNQCINHPSHTPNEFRTQIAHIQIGIGDNVNHIEVDEIYTVTSKEWPSSESNQTLHIYFFNQNI